MLKQPQAILNSYIDSKYGIPAQIKRLTAEQKTPKHSVRARSNSDSGFSSESESDSDSKGKDHKRRCPMLATTSITASSTAFKLSSSQNEDFLVGEELLILKKSDLIYFDMAISNPESGGSLDRAFSDAKPGKALLEFLAQGIATFARDASGGDKYADILKIEHLRNYFDDEKTVDLPLFDINGKFHPRFSDVIKKMTPDDQKNFETFIKSLVQKSADIVYGKQKKFHPWVKDFFGEEKLKDAEGIYGPDTLQRELIHGVLYIITSAHTTLPPATSHYNVYSILPLLVSKMLRTKREVEHNYDIIKRAYSVSPILSPRFEEEKTFFDFSGVLIKDTSQELKNPECLCNGKMTPLQSALAFTASVYSINAYAPELYAASIRQFTPKLREYGSNRLPKEQFDKWMKEKSLLLDTITDYYRVNKEQKDKRKDYSPLLSSIILESEAEKLLKSPFDERHPLITSVRQATHLTRERYILDSKLEQMAIYQYSKQIMAEIDKHHTRQPNPLMTMNLEWVEQTIQLAEMMKNYEEKMAETKDGSRIKDFLIASGSYCTNKFREGAPPLTITPRLERTLHFSKELDTFDNQYRTFCEEKEDDMDIKLSRPYMLFADHLRRRLNFFSSLARDEHGINGDDINEINDLIGLLNTLNTLHSAGSRVQAEASIQRAKKQLYLYSLEFAFDTLQHPPFVERTQTIQSLCDTLNTCATAINNPNNPASVRHLKILAKDIAGKPSTWRKVLGAVCVLGAALAFGLGMVFAIPTFGTSAAIGVYCAYGLTTVAGICLFASGVQRGLSKRVSAVANKMEKFNR